MISFLFPTPDIDNIIASSSPVASSIFNSMFNWVGIEVGVNVASFFIIAILALISSAMAFMLAHITHKQDKYDEENLGMKRLPWYLR